jgi:glyoxylase-like metal-dependent hydrolase (beta-lactamase superfamily II)
MENEKMPVVSSLASFRKISHHRHVPARSAALTPTTRKTYPPRTKLHNIHLRSSKFIRAGQFDSPIKNDDRTHFIVPLCQPRRNSTGENPPNRHNNAQNPCSFEAEHFSQLLHNRAESITPVPTTAIPTAASFVIPSLFMQLSLALLLAASAAAQETALTNRYPLQTGADQKTALKITDAIYQGIGFGNTFLVITPEGNVIIDTSSPNRAAQHVKLLKQVSAAPVKYIILTHGHADHTGGVHLWKEPGTEIVAQKSYLEFMSYQQRLEGFFRTRNAAQFEFNPSATPPSTANGAAKFEPTILFDEKYQFTLGGLTFQIIHTPGETPDHLTVWIPQYRAAFSGDNYYASFPNMYTLRGTRPRWALDYVESLDKVIALKPVLLLPSHGRVIQGLPQIATTLNQYRDAILYVHGATVKGMNEGKDVFTLMREIHLPPNLDVGQSYGRVSWSVRGIYEGYAGWFDLNPATMYELPPTAADADLVGLAGVPAVVKLAADRADAGRDVESLRLTDAVLLADPASHPALEIRVKALESLIAHSGNSNERGWLEHSLAEARNKLKN